MKYKTSFKIKTLVSGDEINLKTFKEVEREVKKLIDAKRSFEVITVFKYQNYSNLIDCEVWSFDAERDVPIRYILEKKQFFKTIDFHSKTFKKNNGSIWSLDQDDFNQTRYKIL